MNLPRTALRLCAAACLALAGLSHAFSVGVSPPRYELEGTPGQTLREILEIGHSSRVPQAVRIATADWRLTDDGSLDILDDLAADSCRPWVALERNHFQLPPQARVRFRFEVRIPPDAPVSECRYVLLVEGAADTANEARPFDIHGRIAVVVYVRVGPARPEISIQDVSAGSAATGWPVLTVANKGSATGRLGGELTWNDDDGNAIQLEPEPAPVLPGRTRKIALRRTTDEAARPPAPARSARLHGQVQVQGESTPLRIDHRFGE